MQIIRISYLINIASPKLKKRYFSETATLYALITNFHLPKSTLIMLVSSLAGIDNIMHAYNVAVEEKYRFFSFGDAMFIK